MSSHPVHPVIRRPGGRQRLGRRSVAAATLLLLIAAAPGLHARAGGGVTPEAESAARALFDQAERSFDRGRFEEALAGYERAFEVMPLPAFLFNMGQCARNLGRYEDARALYRRYLLLDPGASNRRLVDDLIAEMDRVLHDQRRKSALVLTSAPAQGASPVARTGGAHVRDGKAHPLPLGAPEYVATVEARDPARGEERRSVLGRPWFWAALGAVAAGTVALLIVTRDPDPRSTLVPIDCRQGSQCP